MAGMSENPEAPERVALHYAGPNAVRLADSANANPYVIHPGTVVVVEAAAARSLLEAAASTDDPGDATAPLWSVVAGAELDAQLKAANLPTSGSADAKRDRLAAHEYELAAARAAAEATGTPTPSPDATPES